MANLKEVRKRIESVKSTNQVINAMKMVSTSKLYKAQQAIIFTRHYAACFQEIIQQSENDLDQNSYPLLKTTANPRTVLFISIGSNKGLCGAFNDSVSHAAMKYINQNFSHLYPDNVHMISIGKKVSDYFIKASDFASLENFDSILNNLSYDLASPVAEKIMDDFILGSYDAVFLVYNHFVNAATQQVSIEPFLPLKALKSPDILKENGSIDYIYEPDKEIILKKIIPEMIKINFYTALLESYAAENRARMSAMNQANDNAKKLIKELQLSYNKARQEAITNELLDVISGTEALKK